MYSSTLLFVLFFLVAHLTPGTWSVFLIAMRLKRCLSLISFSLTPNIQRNRTKRFWGRDIRGHVIYPVRMLRVFHEKKRIFSKHEKKKVILSVGRFNPFGHSKNQLEIAKAYRSLVTEMPDANQWKLVLAGSYIRSIRSCGLFPLSETLSQRTECRGASKYGKKEFDKLFSDAIIYVHGTGIGCHREREPEKFEHFGITPVEAMQFGCIPVVFDTGGPADLVRCLDIGYCFSSEESLQATLKNLMHRDFSALVRESKTVQERGSQFVDAESCKPLPIDAFINNFMKQRNPNMKLSN